VQADLIGAGLAQAEVVAHAYNPDSPDFAAAAAAVKEFNPDGVLIIGFDETAKLIDELLKAGITSLSR
jgi:ABC-type branched-subunit amino acid transport system substrate-binding protein